MSMDRYDYDKLIQIEENTRKINENLLILIELIKERN